MADVAVDTQASQQGPVKVTVQSLMEAGAHYGHQTQRWNPRMLPFIFTERNGVHIINLDMTVNHWERARKFLVDLSAKGGSVLFVGTKQQARDIVESAAQRCGTYRVTSRWLGGTLSNFETIKRSTNRMEKMEELLKKADDPSTGVKLNKKEKLNITRQLAKLSVNLGGIRDMKSLPSALFIVDINKEAIAVSEANKLHIPVIAMVDTNVDPSRINYPIPSNDDAGRTIELFANAVADAVLEGKQIYASRTPKEERGHKKRSNGAPKGSNLAREESEATESTDTVGESVTAG